MPTTYYQDNGTAPNYAGDDLNKALVNSGSSGGSWSPSIAKNKSQQACFEHETYPTPGSSGTAGTHDVEVYVTSANSAACRKQT